MEQLTTKKNVLDELILEIQKEQSYKIIKETLGSPIYNALMTKNIFYILKEEETLLYKKNKTNLENQVLNVFSELKTFNNEKIMEDLLKCKKDFLESIEQKSIKNASVDYHKWVATIRKFIINMVIAELINIDQLKEYNDIINTTFSSFLSSVQHETTIIDLKEVE